MIVLINSYNRPKSLQKVVTAWLEAGAEVHVFDDGSEMAPLKYVYWHHFEHKGKRGYWQIWDAMLKMLRTRTDHELIIFSPDDFTAPKVDEILAQHERLNKWAYAHNIINDGRNACWTAFMPRVIDSGLMEVGFVDCGFFCNRKALDAISYYVSAIPENWHNTHGSSGVGYQLSKRMLKRAVTMLLPMKSLAYHGNHESKMHPELRKKQPLKSK